MSKLAISQRVPFAYDRATIFELLRLVEQQVNQISEGAIVAFHGALTAAPTLGSWVRGDRVLNSAPSVLGSAGSRYTIEGWVCVTSGSPGTWVERRTLTGT